MPRILTERFAYVRLLLSTRRLGLMSAPATFLGVLGLYDLLVSQFVASPSHWPRAYEFLPDLPWQSWALIALAPILIVGFESAYRLHAVVQRKGEQYAQDEIVSAITRLKTQQISSEYSVTAFEVFSALVNEMATGVEHRLILGILNEKLGTICDWQQVELDPVLTPMILAGVIESYRKDGDSPIQPGVYALGAALPADVYKLTPLGIGVVNRIMDGVFG